MHAQEGDVEESLDLDLFVDLEREAFVYELCELALVTQPPCLLA